MVKEQRTSVDSGNRAAFQLHCGIHNFGSDDPIKFDKHMDGPEHYEIGHAPCFYCQERFSYTLADKISRFRVMKGTAMHPKCAKQFAKENGLV